jgi:hypothetical protein
MSINQVILLCPSGAIIPPDDRPVHHVVDENARCAVEIEPLT